MGGGKGRGRGEVGRGEGGKEEKEEKGEGGRKSRGKGGGRGRREVIVGVETVILVSCRTLYMIWGVVLTSCNMVKLVCLRKSVCRVSLMVSAVPCNLTEKVHLVNYTRGREAIL